MQVYFGTYTDAPFGQGEGIYRADFDPETGTLSPLTVVATPSNPSWIVANADGSVLYVTAEGDAGQVIAYRRDVVTGALTEINRVSSEGASPCYASVTQDGRFVLTANYTSATIAIAPIAEDGGLVAATDTAAHHGSSVVGDRQGEAHAHSIVQTPDGGWALVADLGTDELVAHRLDLASGTFRDGEGDVVATAVTPGAGPRHIAFSPDGTTAYVINELDSTLSAYAWDATTGTLTLRQTVSTLPADFTDTNYPAQVLVSADGRFVYGSNRLFDSIATWSVDAETGELALIDQTQVGAYPRNFAISPDGRWVIALAQQGDDLRVLARDGETGLLSPTGEPIAIPNPAVVTFVGA